MSFLFLQRRFFGPIRAAEMSAGTTREHTNFFGSSLFADKISEEKKCVIGTSGGERKKMLLNNFSSTLKDFVTVFFLRQSKEHREINGTLKVLTLTLTASRQRLSPCMRAESFSAAACCRRCLRRGNVNL